MPTNPTRKPNRSISATAESIYREYYRSVPIAREYEAGQLPDVESTNTLRGVSTNIIYDELTSAYYTSDQLRGIEEAMIKSHSIECLYGAKKITQRRSTRGSINGKGDTIGTLLIIIILIGLFYLLSGNIGKIFVLVTLGVIFNPYVLFVVYICYKFLSIGDHK